MEKHFKFIKMHPYYKAKNHLRQYPNFKNFSENVINLQKNSRKLRLFFIFCIYLRKNYIFKLIPFSAKFSITDLWKFSISSPVSVWSNA